MTQGVASPSYAEPGTAALTDEQVAQFDRDGFLVVRGYLGKAEVDEIRDAFMAQAKDGPVAGMSDTGRLLGPADPLARYPRMMNPHRHPDKVVGPVSMKHMLAPRLGGMLRSIMRDEPVAAQSMFYFKPPGARGQDFHQDNFYLRVKPGTCMAAWLAVDDCDAANGTMCVVPGSHRTDVVCPEKADPARFFTTEHVPLPPGLHEHRCDLAPGDLLFFNGSLIHGSYPNATADRFRRSLIYHYVPESCHEVAHWYKPLLRFDGTTIERAQATGGGPCGTVQSLPTARH